MQSLFISDVQDSQNKQEIINKPTEMNPFFKSAAVASARCGLGCCLALRSDPWWPPLKRPTILWVGAPPSAWTVAVHTVPTELRLQGSEKTAP